MTWVVIVVVLLVAFGPVLWLVPSRKDRRLTALRTRARSEGLLVDMRHLPKTDPTPQERVSAGGQVREPMVECAAYGRLFARKLRYLPSWRLVRRPADGRPDPFPDWQFLIRPKGDGRAHLEPMLSLASAFLKRLPDDVAGLEVDSKSVFVYWLEKPGSTPETVTSMAAALGDFEADLEALDRRLAPNADDADS